jgi:hypothetical protein
MCVSVIDVCSDIFDYVVLAPNVYHYILKLASEPAPRALHFPEVRIDEIGWVLIVLIIIEVAQVIIIVLIFFLILLRRAVFLNITVNISGNIRGRVSVLMFNWFLFLLMMTSFLLFES